MRIDEIISGYESRFLYENNFPKKIIAGLDEVGRGALAGPIVTAAVILNRENDIKKIFDSKQLSKKNRNELYSLITDSAIDFSIDIMESSEVDELNVYKGTQLSMKRAVLGLNVQPDVLLIDAMKIDLEIEQNKIIHGDQISNSIAAASILAKVTRDRIMSDFSKKYPHYEFEKNVGYGTKKHIEALRKMGVTDIHRKTFEPVRRFNK